MGTAFIHLNELFEFKALIGLTFGLLILISYVATALKPGLRSIPGPGLARFTYLYRPLKISKGDAPNFYRNLHEKYGPLVRTGPNSVDISDPAVLPIIYGINSKFLKVSNAPEGILDKNTSDENSVGILQCFQSNLRGQNHA